MTKPFDDLAEFYRRKFLPLINTFPRIVDLFIYFLTMVVIVLSVIAGFIFFI